MIQLAFILVAILVILPLVLLSKIGSTNRRVIELLAEVSELNKQVRSLLKQYDTEEKLEQDLPPIPTESTFNVPSSEELTENLQPNFLCMEEEQEEELEQPPLYAAIESNQNEIPIPASFAAATTTTPTPPTLPPPYPVVTAPTDEVEQEHEISFIEKLLGGNLLAKIGIITLVLGVGFFVKYAIDRGWVNEFGRVAIGLFTGGVIIGIAHKLKAKYNVFSSILVGGGISVFYVTITLAFREYEIFSQPVAFALLIAVTLFSVILSLFYNRQELAIFSLIGGVLAPLLVSTETGSYSILFSYLLILNTGMLFISLKKSWNLIGIFTYVSSLLFYWGWLVGRFTDQYTGALLFASLFFLQFYTLALIKHFREGYKLTLYQQMLILTNNLSVFFASMFILSTDLIDFRGLATLVIGVANAVVLLTLFRRSKVDKNIIYLIIALVMSFVSLAIPIQLRGYVITLFWSAEAVLLLWLWQRSKIKVFHVGFLLVSALSLVSYLMDVFGNYNYLVETPNLINKIFVTGVVLLISFGVNLLLLRRERTYTSAESGLTKWVALDGLITLFKFIFTILLFFVLFLELNHQLEVHTENNVNVSSFRYLTLATYTYLFIGALAIMSRKTLSTRKFYLFLAAFALYVFEYGYLVADLRFDIYCLASYPRSYFFMHLLSLPAIGYLVYLLAKQVRKRGLLFFTILSWVLLILSVITLSIELDNVVIMFAGTANNYYELLTDVHTFGYPILWGLIAGGLMVWGLQIKEVLLRKISLMSFALIIIKFYAYDVWDMSQAGRIVSFIALGIILLAVSFMQQRIKTLIKADDVATEPTDNEE